ncbi:MAG: aldo/keto reductase [Paludibacteraceae bacterium]|nr:aldo/keto reductase [Paludibacteraceae bacterium]
MAKKIDRRDFLKIFGGAAVASSAVLTACKGKNAQLTTAAQQEPPIGKMTMRINPNTGDKVSLLGYGMMRLPVVGGGAGRERPDADIDQELVNRQVDYALEHGVNLFDTSPAYCQGRSETATGIALARHNRNEFFISTKLSNFAPETWGLKESQEMFYNSLKYLQVDYLDYLLLHCCGLGAQALDGRQLNGMEAFHARFVDNKLIDWLSEQREAGKIRNLGFSYHGDVEVFNLLLRWHDEGKYHFDFVLIELNYLDWNFADEINPRNTDAVYLYNELHKRGIAALVMEPLLGGRLANVPDPIVAKMKSRRPEDSVASWAFRFAGTPEGVLSVLSGMTYMEHLRENLCTYSPLQPITKDEDEFLMEIARDIYDLKTIPCNECNYCMPCPYGIDIPAIFVHYNKMIKEGNLPHNRQSEIYTKQRKAFLVGYDRSVPNLRQADHCIGCGECVSHCPQRIDIPKEMHRIDNLVENLKRNGAVEDKVD